MICLCTLAGTNACMYCSNRGAVFPVQMYTPYQFYPPNEPIDYERVAELVAEKLKQTEKPKPE